MGRCLTRGDIISISNIVKGVRTEEMEKSLCPYCKSKLRIGENGYFCENQSCYANSWRCKFYEWYFNMGVLITYIVYKVIVFKTNLTFKSKVIEFINKMFSIIFLIG